MKLTTVKAETLQIGDIITNGKSISKIKGIRRLSEVSKVLEFEVEELKIYLGAAEHNKISFLFHQSKELLKLDLD